jgi:hypothetical protein
VEYNIKGLGGFMAYIYLNSRLMISLLKIKNTSSLTVHSLNSVGIKQSSMPRAEFCGLPEPFGSSLLPLLLLIPARPVDSYSRPENEGMSSCCFRPKV